MNYNTWKLVLISTASAQEKAQGTLENREDQNQENARLSLNIVPKPGFEGQGDKPRMDKLTIARLGYNRPLNVFFVFQFLTYTSEEKYFDTTRETTLKLVDLSSLKVLRLKQGKISLRKDTKFYTRLYAGGKSPPPPSQHTNVCKIWTHQAYSHIHTTPLQIFPCLTKVNI